MNYDRLLVVTLRNTAVLITAVINYNNMVMGN